MVYDLVEISDSLEELEETIREALNFIQTECMAVDRRVSEAVRSYVFAKRKEVLLLLDTVSEETVTMKMSNGNAVKHFEKLQLLLAGWWEDLQPTMKRLPQVTKEKIRKRHDAVSMESTRIANHIFKFLKESEEGTFV